MKTTLIILLCTTVLLWGCKSSMQKDVECYKEVESYCWIWNVSIHYYVMTCDGRCINYSEVK